MTTGIQGTGPYGRIRFLRNEISGYRYELRLIAEGMKRPLSKKRLQDLIKIHREEIRGILKAQAAQKK